MERGLLAYFPALGNAAQLLCHLNIIFLPQTHVVSALGAWEAYLDSNV